jgi:hypothetical protein
MIIKALPAVVVAVGIIPGLAVLARRVLGALLRQRVAAVRVVRQARQARPVLRQVIPMCISAPAMAVAVAVEQPLMTAATVVMGLLAAVAVVVALPALAAWYPVMAEMAAQAA